MKKKFTFQQQLLIFCSVWLTVCAAVLIGFFVCTFQKSMLQIEARTAEILVQKLGEESEKFVYSGDQEGLKGLLKTYKALPHVLEAQLKYNDINLFENGTGDPLRHQDPTRHYGNSDFILVAEEHALKTSTSFLLQPSEIRGIPDDKPTLKPGRPLEVSITLSVEPVFIETKQMIRKSLGMILVILIGGVFSGWKISGTLVSPLKKLAKLTVTASDTSPQAADEIELIGNHLNALKHTIDEKHVEAVNAQIVSANLSSENNDLSTLIKSKNDFVYQISHEIKTPLSAIAMHIDNIRNESHGKLNETQKDRLERVAQISARLSRMSEPLIGFAMSETNNLDKMGKAINLATSAEQVHFSLEKELKKYQVECRIDISIYGKQVFANPDHVEQIFLNLIHNAIKASPPGARVIVKAANHDKEHFRIFIQDTGFGIDEALSETIFKRPVPSQNSDSHGIGLYICKFLIEINGGRIWFQTRAVQGTTFSFTLPKVQPHLIKKELEHGRQNTYR